MSGIKKKGQEWYKELQVILCEVSFFSVTCFQLACGVFAKNGVYVKILTDMHVHTQNIQNMQVSRDFISSSSI